MDKMWEMLPLIVMFVVTAVIVKQILDHKTRGKLIDKGMVDENIRYLYLDKPKSQILSALKWGMVLIAIGLAVFVGQMVRTDLTEEVTIGCMFIFGGLALVIYYLIANRMLEKSKGESSETQVR